MVGFYVGHGRHWEFLRLAGRSDDELAALLYETYNSPHTNVAFQAGDVRLVCEANKELAIGLLLQGERIALAFPYVNGGHSWPIEVRDRYEWPNPIEGQLIGSCHGAKVAWFDPHYAENRSRYAKVKGPQNFQMNALAYRVGRTRFANREQEAQMGEMKAYLPLTDEGDFTASEDEIQFVSHVEAVRSLDFHRVAVDVYTLTLALPDDFPMRLNVYTPRVVAEDILTVGERISGVCWLFGRLAEPVSGESPGGTPHS